LLSIKKCCFKGYNNFELPFGNDETDAGCIKLKKILRRVIEKEINSGYVNFICGFDLGSDTYFAEILLELKAEHPYVKLESAIPFENQAVNWSEDERERYYNLLACCDIETMLQTQYSKDCVKKRNKYMVKQSDVLITVYNGMLSSTMETVNYAKQLNKRIICIDPATFRVAENKIKN
jgi:uncharacterized phage-like protein YoqJ